MKNLSPSPTPLKRERRASASVIPVDRIVFISSTYEDLAEHRRAAWEVLEEFKVAVRGMENFGARSEAPKETCLAEVEQSDIYVGIIAFRLGSIDPQTGKSFTQLEYERALQLNKEILIYLADEKEARFRKTDFDSDQSRIEEFKRTLKERHIVNAFSTPEDLAEKLKTDFAKRFPPTLEKGKTAESEFESALTLVRRFRLIPSAVSGREIRLVIKTYFNPFPATRSLCKAFNLEYGYTIGAHMRILEPKHADMEGFKEIYASGLRVDEFLSLIANRESVEIYARLQFTPDDIPTGQAEFFGYNNYYYEGPEPEDPNVGYVAPEGRVILLFSKTAS